MGVSGGRFEKEPGGKKAIVKSDLSSEDVRE
jgi:hypothetical protein